MYVVFFFSFLVFQSGVVRKSVTYKKKKKNKKKKMGQPSQQDPATPIQITSIKKCVATRYASGKITRDNDGVDKKKHSHLCTLAKLSNRTLWLAEKKALFVKADQNKLLFSCSFGLTKAWLQQLNTNKQ